MTIAERAFQRGQRVKIIGPWPATGCIGTIIGQKGEFLDVRVFGGGKLRHICFRAEELERVEEKKQ